VTSSIRTRTAAALIAVAAVLLLATGSAFAATQRPAGMSSAEYRALMIRSEALNAKYGLGEFAGKPAAMSQDEWRALQIRSTALNRKYHLGAFKTASAPVTLAARGFEWGAFGVGAAAMLGLVALVAGLSLGGRHSRVALKARSSS
jgi:hypothetical protein